MKKHLKLSSKLAGAFMLGLTFLMSCSKSEPSEELDVPIVEKTQLVLTASSTEVEKDDEVKLWYVTDDYAQYSDWFRFQDDLNEEIGGDEKIIEVYAEGHNLWNRESVEFRLNPPRLETDDVLKSPKFGFPSVVCTGEFSMDLPGEEFVATWNKPVSRVEGKDYFDILIFDDKGTEINRTARSEVEWKQIVTGYFTRDMDEGEMQIAAISEKANDGAFPVFIFNRGFAEPDTILFSENIDPGIKIFSSTDHRLRVDFD